MNSALSTTRGDSAVCSFCSLSLSETHMKQETSYSRLTDTHIKLGIPYFEKSSMNGPHITHIMTSANRLQPKPSGASLKKLPSTNQTRYIYTDAFKRNDSCSIAFYSAHPTNFQSQRNLRLLSSVLSAELIAIYHVRKHLQRDPYTLRI